MSIENSVDIPDGFVQSVLDKEGLSSVENDKSPDDQIRDDHQYDVIIATAKKTFNTLFESFDSESKKRGLPGLGSVPSKDLSELVVIVGEKRLPREMIENSPEAALGVVLSGIVANNFLQYKKQKNSAEKESKKEGVHNEN